VKGVEEIVDTELDRVSNQQLNALESKLQGRDADEEMAEDKK
jgi:hypothetical protein